MKPVRTSKATATFVLKGGTEVNDLPVEQTEDEDGRPVLVSTWYLSEEERRRISIGKRVVLTVWGIGTPPVALSVEEADAIDVEPWRVETRGRGMTAQDSSEMAGVPWPGEIRGGSDDG